VRVAAGQYELERPAQLVALLTKMAHNKLAWHEDTLVLIVGEILLRRKLGKQPTLPEYQQRFPQLANEIEIQFEIDRLWEDAEQEPVRSIACPVCKNAMEELSATSGQVVCPACGSSFLLEQETQAWNPVAGSRMLGK
jgi:hypothetical protein